MAPRKGLVAAPLPHQRNTQSKSRTSRTPHTTNDTLEQVEGIFQCFPSEVTAKVNQTDGVVNYAFVNNPSDAEQAVKQLNGLRIVGQVRLHSTGEDTVSSSSSYE